MREIYLSKTFDILKKLFYIHLVFLVFMTLFRVVFFNYYLELDSFDNYYFDILNAFFIPTIFGNKYVLPASGTTPSDTKGGLIFALLPQTT